tara:strand:- start:228 stop:1154 length:927 start_codon:yes stop_codon:yes gene_type:complete
MDRRTFNTLVAGGASGLLGASFLNSAIAEPKKPTKALEPEYQPQMRPGQITVAGLLDGKRTFAANYFPFWPVWDWVARINNYVLPAMSMRTDWREDQVDLVWTDYWRCFSDSGQIYHESLGPYKPPRDAWIRDKNEHQTKLFFRDKWGNRLHWEPNSHQVGENTPPRRATIFMHEYVDSPAPASIKPLMSRYFYQSYGDGSLTLQTLDNIPYPCKIYTNEWIPTIRRLFLRTIDAQPNLIASWQGVYKKYALPRSGSQVHLIYYIGRGDDGTQYLESAISTQREETERLPRFVRWVSDMEAYRACEQW